MRPLRAKQNNSILLFLQHTDKETFVIIPSRYNSKTKGEGNCREQGLHPPRRMRQKTRNRRAPGSSCGEIKDFSPIIAQAKTCPPPAQIETGTIIGGFAHAQVLAFLSPNVTNLLVSKFGIAGITTVEDDIKLLG